jgi:hypothetical protein
MGKNPVSVMMISQFLSGLKDGEEDMSVACGMLALLRATLRNAVYHGFEAARYSY